MSSTTSMPLSLPGDARISPRELSTARSLAIVLAVVGAAALAIGAAKDLRAFAFSYFLGFLCLVTVGLGALFFVLVQHVTGAAWSLAPRRQMEWISGLLLLAIPLFVPMLFLGPEVWHHWMSPHAHEDPAIAAKAAWLNAPFFYTRSFFYLSVWAGLSMYVFRRSTRHDETGDARELERLARVSAPSLLVFALTVTFAAFDWVMSLDPHWYSTIFGVYIFAGSVVSALALLSLLALSLERRGYFGPIFGVEHRHDVGKLLFGFTVFWAYIAFSQYLLIWYANIPEETEFYVHRLQGSWKTVSILLIVGHFAVPFLLLLSRGVKRNPLGLALGAVILLSMHVVDLYWLLMPIRDEHGVHLSISDVGALLFVVGVGAFQISARVKKSAAFPLRDPRLVEAASLENL